MEKIIIGATLLFKKNTKDISGVLKSIVVTSTKAELKKDIDNRGDEISQFYDYEFVGLNDIFFVSGEIAQGEILGRTTYYDLDTLSKAKSIVSKEFSFDNFSKSKQFNCSVVYFCKNFNNDKFTISIITILNSLATSIVDDTHNVANDPLFIEKIKANSIEKIESIKYVGIDDIGETDLKFGVFQSFYAEFDDEETLMEEIIPENEIILKLDEILK